MVKSPSHTVQSPSHYVKPKFHIVKRKINTETTAKTPGVRSPPKGGSLIPRGVGADGGGLVADTDKIGARFAHTVAGGAALATSKSGLQGILDGLDSLTALERKQLLDRLALQELSTKTDQDRDISMWAVSLQSGLVAFVGGLGGSAYGVAHVRKLAGAAKAWAPVADLAAALGMESLSISERQAAYNVLASVLLQHAKQAASRNGAAMSLNYVLNCAQSIGAAFEASFPGYISGGCGRLLFAMMRKARVAAHA